MMDGSYSIVIDGEKFDVSVRSLGREAGERRFEVSVGESRHLVSVGTDGEPRPAVRSDLGFSGGPKVRPIRDGKRPGGGGNGKRSAEGKSVVGAPMTGKIVSIHVTEGQEVKEGDLLVVLEAMKMENSILALESGVIGAISVKVGDSVRKGDELCALASSAA